MQWIVDVIIGVIAGLVSGAVVSGVFYWLAGRDLVREVEKLRKLNIMTINALDEGGIADVNRDATGDPIGLQYRRHVDETVAVSITEKAVVVRHDPQPPAE